MTRWLARSLWLAAWSFWLWLGFGLYRELPRDLGPVVCKLELSENERPLGFLSGGQSIATIEYVGPKDETSINILDARNGLRIAQFNGPRLEENRRKVEPLLCHSLVVTGEFNPSTSTHEMWILDAETGRRTVIDLIGSTNGTFHRSKPWAIFFTYGLDEASAYQSVRAFDLKSGRTLLKWTQSKSAGKLLDATPFFIDEDRIGIPVRGVLPDRSNWLEIWSGSNASRPERVIKDLRLGSIGTNTAVSRAGRAVWIATEEFDLVTRVFDLGAERLVFENPTERRGHTFPGTPMFPQASPRISDDGTTILDRQKQILWNVDDGRILWSGSFGGEPETGSWFPTGALTWTDIVDSDPPGEFEAAEPWYFAWGSWSTRQKTFAVRSLKDGSLIHRCWNPTTERNNSCREAGLLIDEEWNVRTLPPHVNYPLLALCQAILALPLVLLWAVLRWRRNRRLRLSSVTP